MVAHLLKKFKGTHGFANSGRVAEWLKAPDSKFKKHSLS
jgi:hypothetical protein